MVDYKVTKIKCIIKNNYYLIGGDKVDRYGNSEIFKPVNRKTFPENFHNNRYASLHGTGNRKKQRIFFSS